MSDSVSRNNSGSSSTNKADQAASAQNAAHPSRPPQEAPKRAAKMPAANAPIVAPPGQPTSAYKPVNPNTGTEQQSKKAKKGGNKLLIVGIVVCLLAVVALVCSLLFVMNKPSDTGSQQSSANVPSNSQITKALEDANLQVPNVSAYKYISTDDLTGPEFAEIETEQGSSSNVCNVSAKSIFRNSSVIIEQPVALRFTQKDNDWIPGTVTTSPATVTPAGAPDMQALTKDLPNLLAAFDENVANQFTNSDIVADSKGLTARGGSVKFTLEKAENDAVKKCDVNVKVEWKNDTGWNPQIESVSNVTTAENQEQSDSTNENPSDSGSDDQPDALLQCSSGDLVQIPGIIDYVSDRFLLRADNYIRVEMDGKVFNTRYFELQSNTMQFTVGSHVEVTGVITETGILRQAPLVLNLDM